MRAEKELEQTDTCNYMPEPIKTSPTWKSRPDIHLQQWPEIPMVNMTPNRMPTFVDD